ncbi:MAG: peptidoglycan DD-metalloendopeptidase family protein [Thiotrichales bacterium]|nr:MAG: peptidoglycan DD-metalloendopeptidase family protein [Thiotrichales bacterium]
MRFHRTVTAICSALLSMTAHPVYATPEQALVPGGIAIVNVENYTPGTRITFDSRKTTIFKQGDSWYALAGIPLKAKSGEYSFEIKQPDGTTRIRKIDIKHKKYQEQRLTIKNKRKVNPNLEDMARISKERVRKREAKNHWSETYPDVDFIWPVSGQISSIFGLRRFFNEQERNPHSGLDIAAPEGTDIQVTADGTVIETGDFFFSGNMVYVDHGQGLISLYAHLSRIDVKPGDVLRRGDILGAVGQTGRVTGAHLHFAVLANGVLVDPRYFLSSEQPAAQFTESGKNQAGSPDGGSNYADSQ